MKKYLMILFLIIMFVPVIVNAETCDSSKVVIESIDIKDNDNVDVIEDATAHHMEIAVMQFLDGRRLETLAPAQTETEVAGREHRADLGRQAETEVAVID